MRRRTLSLVLLGLVVLAAPALAQKKPSELILGKWEATKKVDGKDEKIECEFTKDGKLMVSVLGVTLQREYKIADDGTLEVTDMGKTRTFKVKVSEDTLEVPDSDKQTLKMTRKK